MQNEQSQLNEVPSQGLALRQTVGSLAAASEMMGQAVVDIVVDVVVGHPGIAK